jgi:nucleoside 2-deoxyribosyltransferase
MKKVYVASLLGNAERISHINSILRSNGIQITYDWTVHGKVVDVHEMAKIALLEEQGVIDCDIFFMVLPGGSGTHFEFGLARALNKKIVILNDYSVEQKTFYYLPEICRFDDLNSAIDKIIEMD